MKVHAQGVTNAKRLIAEGAIDLVSGWSKATDAEIDGLRADASTVFLDQQEQGSIFAVTKGGKIVRAALRDCLTCAESPEIKAAARELLNAIDDRTISAALQHRPDRRRSPKANADLRQWYRFSAVADDGLNSGQVADIYIYDYIGEYYEWADDGYELCGVSAKSFLADLKALPSSVSTVRIHVNSRGGDAFDALAIANALRQYGARIEILIEGVCASAATVITCAGDDIQMADNALFMMHRSRTGEYGTSDDLRAMAEALDRVDDAIIATYRWVSPLSPAAVKDLMVTETWMGANEALEAGFVTNVVSGLKVSATLDRRVLNTIPERYRVRAEAFVTPAPVVVAAADVMRLCREAGCTELAESLIGANLALAEVTARVEKAKTDKAAAAARATEIQARATSRATEITALCVTAQVPEFAAGYIACAMPIEDVRAHLVSVQARLHSAEIDTGLRPGPIAAKHTISASDIYANRNGLQTKEQRQ